MLFQRINRSDAEKAYIIAKNTSGAELAINVPVYFETDEQSDGVAVSQMAAAPGQMLFAGINHSALADDGYGLVQVYGVRDSAVILVGQSTVSMLPGTKLLGVAGAAYLQCAASATSLFSDAQLLATADNFCYTMDTQSAAAAKSNTTNNSKVFIRAL